VEEITVVGDRPEDLEGALGHMRDRGLDLIVTSGGLGPTADDLTAEVVGRFAGRDLVLDTEMEEKIAQIIARYARRLRFDPEAVREANRKQAMVPDGATALDPAGTAPGLVVPADGQVVIVLPGPPRELQEMWPRALAATAAEEVLDRAEPYLTMSIRMFGIPESELAKVLREIQDNGVDPKLIEDRGAVSPEVAEAMADGALERFEADVACAITGIAGPDGGTEEKPIGYVCFCAKSAAGEVLARDPILPGSRNDVRERSVVVALHLVRYLLEGREPPR